MRVWELPEGTIARDSVTAGTASSQPPGACMPGSLEPTWTGLLGPTELCTLQLQPLVLTKDGGEERQLSTPQIGQHRTEGTAITH